MSLTPFPFPSIIFPFLQQGSAQLRPAVPVRSLWNGWRSGFSSSSAVNQEEKDDGKTPAAAGAEAAAAEGAPTDEETEQKYTPEELQAALNECVENLEAEKKKVKGEDN
jgi:hypothetical protein